MTNGEKIKEAANIPDLLTSLLLDLNEIQRARLARVLIEGIPWLREEHHALGQHIRRHTRVGEEKEIDQ